MQSIHDVYSPPQVAAMKEQMEQFDRETAYFLAHREELLRQYPDQWVAIYGERVVAAHEDYRQLIANLRALGVPPGRAYMKPMLTNPPILIV